MKKIISLLFIFSLCFTASFSVKAESLISVYAEKVWSIGMSDNILNKKDNISKVYVLNEHGEKVTIKAEVNKDDHSILEVSHESSFEVGNYTLFIPEGFMSAAGVATTEEVTYKYNVETEASKDVIVGVWASEYLYQGELVDIEVKFSNNQPYVVLTQGLTTIIRTPTYTIEDGTMTMTISGIDMKLEGYFKYYNDGTFKIISLNGKEATFTKIKNISE